MISIPVQWRGPGSELHKPKPINPATGIYFISDWGANCQRGFVSDSRFASSSSETVIKRTNRETTRKWRKVQA